MPRKLVLEKMCYSVLVLRICSAEGGGEKTFFSFPHKGVYRWLAVCEHLYKL